MALSLLNSPRKQLSASLRHPIAKKYFSLTHSLTHSLTLPITDSLIHSRLIAQYNTVGSPESPQSPQANDVDRLDCHATKRIPLWIAPRNYALPFAWKLHECECARVGEWMSGCESWWVNEWVGKRIGGLMTVDGWDGDSGWVGEWVAVWIAVNDMWMRGPVVEWIGKNNNRIEYESIAYHIIQYNSIA